MSNVIVVGAGLFGSITAKVLQNAGHSVILLDSRKKFRGSKPAACLMKPSWMSSVNYKEPMSLLDKLYGVETLKFDILGPVKADCYWVNPRSILLDSDLTKIKEEVIQVGDGFVITEEKTYTGIVIVAAGIWSEEILKKSGFASPEIRSLVGSCVLGEGVVKTPTIKIIGPYKQAVWFSRSDNETWFGDSTSILQKNYSEEHTDRTAQRALDIAKIYGKSVVGYRPYVKGTNDGVCEKLADKLYLSTGGAKNGTILSASNSLKLLSMIR